MKFLHKYLLVLILVALPFIANAVTLSKSIDLVAASSQYLSVADSTSLSRVNEQTHEGWFDFTSFPSSGNSMNLFSKYVAAPGQRGISMVYENSGGTYRFHARTSSDGSTVLEGTLNYTIPSGFHYLRFIYYTTGSIDVYVDDLTTPVGIISSLSTSIKDNTAPYQIGANTDIGGNYDGYVSLYRVWNGNHTANDKCTVYGTATTDLEAEWSLNNVLTDASGNGNTLTNNNAAAFISSVPDCLKATTFVPAWDF